MSYARINQIGPQVDNSFLNNPLSYCVTSDLNNSFLHTAGQKYGPYSVPCQMYMSDYCSNKWDGICEYASKNINKDYPNSLARTDPLVSNSGPNFTQGENLIRNTAMKKYLSKLSGNCTIKYSPFDPLNASSPQVGRITSSDYDTNDCIAIYEVNPEIIDKDIVMNKILDHPGIAMDILVNIYNNARNQGRLENLKGTRLYRFYMSPDFQAYKSIARNNASRLSGIKYK